MTSVRLGKVSPCTAPAPPQRLRDRHADFLDTVRDGPIWVKVILVLFTGWIPPRSYGVEFTFELLRDEARALARTPFQPPQSPTPSDLLNLTYLEHAAIQFRPERALWRGQGLPFEIEFFHPGYVHRDAVQIYEMNRSEPIPVTFSTTLFRYGTNRVDPSTNGAFAGFRINRPKDQFGEVGAFSGASYFRMIGRGQSYGSSARGLAVDTLGREEFPVFRRFWLQRPTRRSESLLVLALLDSPGVAGAFEFVVQPGPTTRAHVRAALSPRRELTDYGLSPLTSMFLHDDNGRQVYTDFRPEVHDADGLLLHTGQDRWIWRPLEKGRMLRANAYADESPRGFGLLQRDRDFEHYEDLVAHFERRPSVWIEPVGNWGRGAVKLVQLPSDVEFSDNIVAYWTPEPPLRPGDLLEYEYVIHWTTNRVVPDSLAQVRSTRIGVVVEEPRKTPPNLRFVVDFDPGPKAALPDDGQLKPEVSCGPGARRVSETFLRNPLNGTCRLVIEITQPTAAVDLTAVLMANGRRVSETWNYTWQP